MSNDDILRAHESPAEPSVNPGDQFHPETASPTVFGRMPGASSDARDPTPPSEFMGPNDTRPSMSAFTPNSVPTEPLPGVFHNPNAGQMGELMAKRSEEARQASQVNAAEHWRQVEASQAAGETADSSTELMRMPELTVHDFATQAFYYDRAASFLTSIGAPQPVIEAVAHLRDQRSDSAQKLPSLHTPPPPAEQTT